MIQDKVVAITGASSGIGAATARVLAAAGAKVVLGARRLDRIEALAAELGGVAWATDVTRRGDLSALVALAETRFGKLDVLVGNAGIARIGPLDELAVDDWLAMVDVNLNGFLYGVAAALPVFRRQGFGHFVTTISTAGLRVSPNQSIYAGTKNAVRTIHEGLRQEAGPKLRVTGVSPGYVRTELATASIQHPETRAKAGHMITLVRSGGMWSIRKASAVDRWLRLAPPGFACWRSRARSKRGSNGASRSSSARGCW